MLRNRWVWLLTSAGEQGSAGLSVKMALCSAIPRRAQTEQTGGNQSWGEAKALITFSVSAFLKIVYLFH